ncbi:MAG: SpoVA/SpoVAEb family sporulation membrane protein [Limnochordia bacterium]|nr:SpoVA/SpoVAEb family sporulation membrane protein [Bacillota bacterium]
MTYLWAFLIGGAICALAQLIMDVFKLPPAYILVGLTVTGAVLNGLGLYQPLLEFAGAGALIPVCGFGNAIATGIIAEVKRLGWEGLFTGAFELTGLGVTSAVVFGFLVALVSGPRR